ncbi:transglycosylase SLT domain-containing protein [Paraburkholderia silviterrae]|uniref:Lytic transglycosylase domain-containing protein n=1 Tax=Paraburkholderia silviterrae TaxID=2528715 RepID=A0A4R5MFK0_9BURK|nr:transglycosylase SLT domain-containing protein [Paraburkholderia silviterrae]TDG25807.1 lytic transglycosylase domain-containing protein [Paraburkholderia silviterrae]
MRRLLCLLVMLPGLVQYAAAQQPPEDDKKLPTYLSQKFGLAKDKAAQISQAVTTAAEKYSLPPAVLLAIISIESRFREKAHGANHATGLMQVVPSAHRNLLRDGKDLTDPEVNIDVGSSILYGYKRAAGGDLDAAMKNYGGSKAYAEKIRMRAAEFSRVLDTASAPQAGAAAADAPATFSGAFSAGMAGNIAASDVSAASTTASPAGTAPAARTSAQSLQSASSFSTASASGASGIDASSMRGALESRSNARSRER